MSARDPTRDQRSPAAEAPSSEAPGPLDTEAALREAQELAGLGRWELDLTTNHLRWSASIYDLFEIAPEAFTASYKAFLGFVHPEDRAQVDETYRDSIAEGRPYAITHRLLMADGRIKWVREVGRTEYGADGTPLRSFGTVQDITELKQVEEELRARNQFIQTILDHLPIGLAVNTVEDGRTGYMNRKFEEIYGWPAQSFTNVQEFFRLVYPDPDYREQLRAQVLADMASGDPARMQWRGLEATGQDGTKRIINADNIPLLDQGLMISTVQDVTAQTRQQEQIRALEHQAHQAQKLETVGRLAGGIAHDFNNLLTVINSYAADVVDALPEGDPLRADLQEIATAGSRAADLTRQLLAFSRKQLLEPRVLDLNTVVANLERMLRRLIGEHIALETTLSANLGLVHADPGQVEQVLMNLAVNARDAMPGGGQLTIETANVDLDEAFATDRPGVTPGPHVLLAVSDSGDGMTEAVRERLFEPFFTTKEQGQGTGLGLATVYGIVRQSGGNIWVFSEPGQGTTFKIYLPRLEPAAAVHPSASNRAADLREAPPATGTILVVEDEASVRRLTARILGSAGFEVLTAANGQEALDLHAQHGPRIRLVLTDVVMPGMSGKVLADRLAERDPDLRILFMSGYTQDAIVHHGVLDEGTHFLGKPFDAAGLLAKIRQVLESE